MKTKANNHGAPQVAVPPILSSPPATNQFPGALPSVPRPSRLIRHLKVIGVIVGIAIPVLMLIIAAITLARELHKQNQDFQLMFEKEKTKQAELSRDEAQHREAEAKLVAQKLETEGRIRLDTEREVTYRSELQNTLLNTQRRQDEAAQAALAKEKTREGEARANNSANELRLAELHAKEQASQEDSIARQREQSRADSERQRAVALNAAVAKAVTDALDDKLASEGALANLVSYYQYPEHRKAILETAAVKVHRVRTLGEAQLLLDILAGGNPSEAFDLACAANNSAKETLEEAIFWRFIAQYLKAAPSVPPEEFLSRFFNNNGASHAMFPQYFQSVVTQRLNSERAVYGDRRWSDRLSVYGMAPRYPRYLLVRASPVIQETLRMVPVPGLRRVIYGPGPRFSRKRFEAALSQVTALNPTLIEQHSVEGQLYLLSESAKLVRKTQSEVSRTCNTLLVPY